MQQINAEIEKEQKELAALRKEMITDKAELRKLLAAVIMKDAWDKTTTSTLYNGVNINGATIGIKDIAEESNFDRFIDAEVYNLVSFRSSVTPIRNTVESALKRAYGDEGYRYRLALVEGKASIPEREARVQKLEDKKAHLQKMTIQELLQARKSDKQDGEDTRTEQEKFINDMLYGGYITANYSVYISSVHEGRFSANDYAFIRSVRVKEPLKEQDFDLHNAHGIIKKLELGNFSQVEILNVDLIDALFGSKEYEAEQEVVIELLKTYSRDCIGFIALYTLIGLHKEVMINKLCADSKNVLGDVIANSALPSDSKLNILISILACAAKEDAIRNVRNSKEYLEKRGDYFKWELPDDRLQHAFCLFRPDCRSHR